VPNPQLPKEDPTSHTAQKPASFDQLKENSEKVDPDLQEILDYLMGKKASLTVTFKDRREEEARKEVQDKGKVETEPKEVSPEPIDDGGWANPSNDGNDYDNGTWKRVPTRQELEFNQKMKSKSSKLEGNSKKPRK